MSQIKGKQSIEFKNTPYIIESASIVGKKEGEGPLAHCFDRVCNDETFGADNWEAAESKLQEDTCNLLFEKSKMNTDDIRYLFSGDLLEQDIATSFGLKNIKIPMFGLFGACSTIGEALSLASMIVGGGYADNVIAMASSHFASAEKQFRFPLDYAGQRPLAATWTVTGCGAYIVGNKPDKVKITGITTGKIIDYGVRDTFNMGAAMAPAAADTILNNLMDFNRKASDYDAIITGDLGYVGKHILIDILREWDIDVADNHIDCGIEIFSPNEQDTHSGGSGCGCAASVFSAYILPKIRSGELKRVLFVPTGALMSKTSFNEGQSIPGIAHGVVIEKA